MAVNLPASGEEPWDAKLNAAITGIDTDLQGHKVAADPHTGYQRESEKGVANGYASLGSDGKVPTAQLPAVSGGGGTVDDSLSGAWFNGKAWTALGTSITAENSYTARLAVLSGMVLTNRGSGGATLSSAGAGQGAIYNNMLATATSAEVITMETINDWRYAVPIGTIADPEDYTLSYFGALKAACNWMLSNRPAARIVMFTAYPDAHPGTVYPNTAGLYHWHYNDAMRQVCNVYGIPVLNVGEEAGINRYTCTYFTKDLIHMNALGGTRYGDYVWSKLRHLGWLGSRPTAPGAVTPVPVTGVSIVQGASATIAMLETLQLSTSIVPANATDKGVTWATTNASVVSVSMDGLITGVAGGSADVTVTTSDGAFTDLIAITVSTVNIPATGVTVTPDTWAGIVTGTTQLTATVAPANATTKTVTWSTDNASIATVSGAGVVTAVGAGTATITATTTDGSFTDTSAITVTSGVVAVTGVTVTPDADATPVGGTVQLTATVAPTAATNKAVSWMSSNPSLATVNSSGLVTAVAVGSVTITATTTDGSFTDTSAITVTPVSVTGITVTPDTATTWIGSTAQLTATVAPANASNKAVVWNSTNAAVASVNSSGLVTGVAEGTANVSALTNDGGFTDTSAITVGGSRPEWDMRSADTFESMGLTGFTWNGSNPTYTGIDPTAEWGAIVWGDAVDNAIEFECGAVDKPAWTVIGTGVDLADRDWLAILVTNGGAGTRGDWNNTHYNSMSGNPTPVAVPWSAATWAPGKKMRVGRVGDRIKIVEVDVSGNATTVRWDGLISANYAGITERGAGLRMGFVCSGLPNSLYTLAINCKVGVWTPP